MNKKVSIVIVARNEEAQIAACIAAAVEACAEIGGAELLVADSASTDKTAAIARAMGARVIRLRPGWELSASAGRHLGAHYAAGEYVLFVDADTLVYKGFPAPAVAAFEADEKLAGVCGFLDDAAAAGAELLVCEERHETATDVRWLRGGCCFYRRAAVRAVGSFNPYLLAEEEADIGLRLTRAGWKLRMIPVPMAVHTRCTEELSGRALFAHLSRSLFAGRVGGTTRTVGYAFKNGYGLEFCRLRMPTAVFFAVWLALVAALAAVPFSLPHSVAGGLSLAGFAAVFYKKGGIKKTLLFFAAKLLYYVNLVLGIPKLKFTPTERYPLDAEILDALPAGE